MKAPRKITGEWKRQEGGRPQAGVSIKGEVKAKIKISPVVVFVVLSRMVLVRES